MNPETRLAFDLGGVIIERGALENFLVEESDVSVKLAVQKFGPDNVFIISKAKEKYIQRNLDLLNKHKFFQKTGLNPAHVYFVNEYEDKGVLGKQLNLTHIVDDSLKVAKIAKECGFEPIIFGPHEEFHKNNPNFMKAKNWKNFRKLLEKLPK